LVNKPPRGSKIEAAKRYGVDLTLTVRRLVEELQRAAHRKEKIHPLVVKPSGKA